MIFDLHRAVPDSISTLRDRGQRPAVGAVLETLGITLPTTLGATPSARGNPTLGRFEIRGELGAGGMGRVLDAWDPDLGREVAVKVFLDPHHVDASQLGRFVAEAQITSQLEHPNIVPVHEIGVTPDGHIYFAMKKVLGRSLRQVLRSLRGGDPETTTAFPSSRLLHGFVQICNAVAYAHDRGVLHRDLKPENIMLGAFGEILLMDWGVARLLRAAALEQGGSPAGLALRTLDGAAVGTPGFMSPEQAAGEAVDARSDVFSLGAILYELLTWQAAYEGDDTLALLWALVSTNPLPPRQRAPERNVPDEIGAVCMRALAKAPADRYPTAADLAAAVEAFLDGSKRREAALGHVEAAKTSWAAYTALTRARAALIEEEAGLGARIEPWAPLEAKSALVAVRQRLRAVGPERARLLSDVLSACDKAFFADPQCGDARALLAEVHYARLEEAERGGDEEERLFHEGRVLEFEAGGRYAELLRGVGAITLVTDPEGAEVLCERYDPSQPFVWPLIERRSLGRTPIERMPLEQGSYLLTIRAPGRRDTRYPVQIRRGQHWQSGEAPLPLFSDAEIGEGFVYVPAGPFRRGGNPDGLDSFPAGDAWVDGFLLAVFPVTAGQYCQFLNDLAAADADRAWARSPRQESGVRGDAGYYWERPASGAPFVVPERDRDGDLWGDDWPILAVSWDDAMAFVAWEEARTGRPTRLPTEQQWEKAARGVDGRSFPWGNDFDPTLCRMQYSRAERSHPEPVGAFPTDCSPYGVRDLAGGVRDWCGDPSFLSDPARMPVRGGSWTAAERHCHPSYRVGMDPRIVSSVLGFRLARPLPARGAQAR